MTLKELKKLIKQNGVKQWIESGYDIIKIGDKLLGDKTKASRLDHAAKVSELCIYEDEIEGHCIASNHCWFGKIVLNNDKTIWYSITD